MPERLDCMKSPVGSAEVTPTRPTGLPAIVRPEGAEFAAVCVQLGLILATVHAFQLGSGGLYLVLLLMGAAFPIHHFLPLRLRLPFFSAVSLAGLPLVLGLVNGLTVIGLGTLLIALCHLPVAFRWRVVAVVATGLALMACRGGWLPLPVDSHVWPVLGSLFMFRAMVYLYDMQTRAVPVSASLFFCAFWETRRRAI